MGDSACDAYEYADAAGCCVYAGEVWLQLGSVADAGTRDACVVTGSYCVHESGAADVCAV